MPGPIPAAAINSAKEYRDRVERLRQEAAVTASPEIRGRSSRPKWFDCLTTSVERTARQLSGGEAPRLDEHLGSLPASAVEQRFCLRRPEIIFYAMHRADLIIGSAHC